MVFRRPRSLSAWLFCPCLLVVLIVYAIKTWPSENENVSVHVGTGRASSLEAIYKCAYQNKDGSVDLVFNIPHGGEELLAINKLTQKAKNRTRPSVATPKEKSANGTAGGGSKRPEIQVKTSYPISLDADYLINTVSVCPAGQRVDYLIIVHSATAYFDRRRIIRETYGGRGILGNVVQRVIFLLGTTPDPDTTRQLREEALLYKDIVQGPFTDSYHNLTHKGVLGFRWISEFCPQAQLMIKIDDDVFMNPFRLVKYVLPAYSNKTRTIACHLRKKGTSPITRGKGKWQVSDMEFKGLAHYPFDYCNGYFVIMTSDLIRPLLKAARLNPFFWIDDVYLFGLLPATVGSTSFINLRENLTLRHETGQSCLEKHGWDCPYLAVSQWIGSKADTLWYQTLGKLTKDKQEELHVFGTS